MVEEPGLGTHAPPQHAAHGPVVASDPDVVVLEAVDCLLADGKPPSNFFLHARAHGAADHASGPHILERGRRLDTEEVEALDELCVSGRWRHLVAEEAEALREPHHPQPGASEAARGMVQGSLPRR